MSINFDLPEVIPVFPLPGALLLPRSRLPLHIFEPRYLSMIEDVLKTPERLIGMIQTSQKNGDERMQAIGCAGRLTQFSETEDEVSWSGFEGDLSLSEKDPNFDRKKFFKILAKYFEARGLSTDWDTLKDADDELLINSLSMLLDFETEDKQALLEAPSLITRRETIVTLIEYSLRGGAGDEIVQ